MALPVSIPNTFANATASIPLSQLDSNFTTLSGAINGINSGSETLANLKATTANLTTANVTTLQSANVQVTGGNLSNVEINFEDKLATRPLLKDYAINGQVLGTLNANTTINLANANFFTATANANVSISFANASAANTLCGAVVALSNGGAYSLTWTNVDWPAGTPPTLTSNGLDILVFITYDAGTIVHGMAASLDSK